MDKKLTPNEVAEVTGLTVHDVVFLLETHAIPATVIDGKWEVNAEELSGVMIVAAVFMLKAAKELKEQDA